MPAPSSMLGRQLLHRSTSNPVDSSGVNEANNGSIHESANADTTALRTSVSNSVDTISHSMATSYDEVFVSKPVNEIKTILWEIKDFNSVFTNRVERAMNFEFEMGRLGSMERHLPRRSRWKISLDVENLGNVRVPSLRVLQLSPENKIIFYKLDACILERTSSGVGGRPTRETEFQTPDSGYKEGINDSESFENLFPIQYSSEATTCNQSCGSDNFLDQIHNYIYDGSLFFKVKIEILEDGST